MRVILLALALAVGLPQAVRALPDAGQPGGKHAYCYFDQTRLIWRLGNDALERVIRFDRDAGSLRTVEVRVKKGGARVAPVGGAEAAFLLAPAGSEAPAVRMDGGWVYMWQIVGTPRPGARRLTIHLQGKGPNAGYEAEAMYEVSPGADPCQAEWYTLINRTGAPRALAGVDFGRWALVEGKTAGRPVFTTTTGRATLLDSVTHSGLMVGVAGPGGEAGYQNGAVGLRLRSALEMLTRGARATTPPALLAVFTGDASTGAALFDRCAAVLAPAPAR